MAEHHLKVGDPIFFAGKGFYVGKPALITGEHTDHKNDRWFILERNLWGDPRIFMVLDLECRRAPNAVIEVLLTGDGDG